jgi:hypothetical protein
MATGDQTERIEGGKTVVRQLPLFCNPPSKRRERIVNLRMSEDEYDRAKRVAERCGLDVSSLIRSLIVEREREMGM